MPRINLHWARPLLPIVTTLLIACVAAGGADRQTYHHGRVAYRVGPLPADWQPVHFKDANLVFRHRAGGTIAASAHCPAGEDVPLAVLTNHELFGIQTQEERGHTLFTLDGRQALRTHLVGQLDGVPVELDLVVLKKDGCSYDLQLIAAPAEFARRQPDFDGFVRGFATGT